MLPKELEEAIAGLLDNLRRLETQIERMDEDPSRWDLARALLRKCAVLRSQIRDLRQQWEEHSDIAAMRETASDRAYGRWLQ